MNIKSLKAEYNEKLSILLFNINKERTVILTIYNILLFYFLKAIARVHRQISEENAPQLSNDTTPALTTQLQVSTAQVSLFNLFIFRLYIS